MISLASLAFNYDDKSIILRLEGLSDHDLKWPFWQRLIHLPISFFRRYSIYDLFTFYEHNFSPLGTIDQPRYSSLSQCRFRDPLFFLDVLL